ncbi:alpha/beta fold hydrolase [Sphingomonas sp. ID1715]|uniref:alpha/beta fold hydrolase n=1 Tax=Sphingomonas sp. ID1715 TaxID=1656898 RepID=UPI001488016D|nr:alpha/beta fold hydrolase [Sphingomonas sp. ID1715]NNM75869.1 alpha/beta fold hydrolase [Sphingomonas sp. ID1715]
MDLVQDILSSMRLSGAVVFDVELVAPWCLYSHYGPEDCARFFPVPAQLIAYHYVAEGQVWVQIGEEAPVLARGGDLVLLPRNDKHLLFSEPGLTPQPMEDVTVDDASGRVRVRQQGEGTRLKMYCGYLGSTAAEPALIQNLPPLMKVHVEEGERQQWTASSLQLASGALAGEPETVARMTELLFTEAVRRYVAELPDEDSSWIAGLRDPAIGRALRLIHERFAEPLDVNSLAREVGMSRSAFAERFTALVGDPPARYHAKWRMKIAANMLRDGRQTSGVVAFEVGFSSEAAFVRAFRREFGEPPASWRRRQAKAAQQGSSPQEGFADCLSADGTRIAYAMLGTGAPVLQPAIWFHHIAKDRGSAAWAHWTHAAADGRRLIRSDLRGLGGSEPHPTRWTFDALLEDFEAVADACGDESFDLLGVSHAALVAIAYAARQPHRVRRLVIYGGYAAGFAVRGGVDEIRRRESLLEMGRIYRDGDRTVFGRMLGALYWPGARGEMIDWCNDRLGAIMSLDEALQDVFRAIDLRDRLALIEAPTLVAHSRGDRIIPFACAEDVAAGIRGAELMPIDSENHVLLGDEPGWTAFEPRLRRFLASPDLPNVRAA